MGFPALLLPLDLNQHGSAPVCSPALDLPRRCHEHSAPSAGDRSGARAEPSPPAQLGVRSPRRSAPYPVCDPERTARDCLQLAGLSCARLSALAEESLFTRPLRLAQACSPSRLRAQRTRRAARPRQGPPAVPAPTRARHGAASAAPRTRPWRSWRRPRSSPSSSTCRWCPRSAPSSTTTWGSTTRTWVSGAGAALGQLRRAPGHGGR